MKEIIKKIFFLSLNLNNFGAEKKPSKTELVLKSFDQNLKRENDEYETERWKERKILFQILLKNIFEYLPSRKQSK